MVNTALPNVSTHGSERPGTVKKPRLMIFDNTDTDLVKAVATYSALGYEVIPVMVHADAMFVNPDATVIDMIADLQPTKHALYDRSHLNILLDRLKPDVVLSDFGWDNANFKNGRDLVRAVQQHQPTIPCMVHSHSVKAQGKVDVSQGIAMVSKDDPASIVDAYFKQHMLRGHLH